VFRFLIMHGLIGVNPLASVTMPRATPGKGADVLTADEVRRVIEVARADDRDGRSSGPERARFYAFLWATALRIGEAKAQLWDDIDWRTGQMRVTKSKARREEILVLPEHLLAQMKTWPRRGLCLKVLETIPSHQAVRRDFERAGISGRGIYHRFRKGAITHMAASGTPIHVLAQFSRHTNINTLYRSYVAPQATELRDALRSLAIWTTGPMESAKKSG
jgi:integrase